jgi:F-type H+-transporting ATPase subunit delta
VIVDPVTQRYADALWSLAKDKGVLPAILSDVSKLSQSLATGAARDAITNPRRERGERREAVMAVASGLHPLVVNLVSLLFDKQREQVLLGLSAALHKLQLQESGQVDGIVESARPLGAAEIALLATSLGPQFGKTLNLTNTIVPELVGGARVVAGNRMIDYSVQGRLEALRRKLLNAPLPAQT